MLAVGRGGAQQHAVCLNDTPTTSAYNLYISGTVDFLLLFGSHLCNCQVTIAHIVSTHVNEEEAKG